jgi:excisionase family DNA binding protein
METHCSIPVAAQKLNCARSHVYNLLGDNKIQAVKAGRRTLVLTASIDNYLAALPPAQIKPSVEAKRRATAT